MSSILKDQPLACSIADERSAGTGIPRALELILAILALVGLFPLLMLCALLVFVSSPGPILFCQQRIGFRGRQFGLYKFRTMVLSRDGLLITASTDRRITPIGRFLRKWKLDELPELYNVMMGQMSFVGPRPEVPELVDFSNRLWDTILSVRPGITDPVTLTLRNEEAMLAMAEDKELFYRDTIQPYKLNGYLKYLRKKTFKGDIKIIARTLKVILSSTPEPHLFGTVDPSFVE
jgi:lipopolysaccharide/colanic/teichoic acid biosynthesis glycosyltransferase